jgi:hypothetical protein
MIDVHINAVANSVFDTESVDDTLGELKLLTVDMPH